MGREATAELAHRAKSRHADRGWRTARRPAPQTRCTSPVSSAEARIALLEAHALDDERAAELCALAAAARIEGARLSVVAPVGEADHQLVLQGVERHLLPPAAAGAIPRLRARHRLRRLLREPGFDLVHARGLAALAVAAARRLLGGRPLVFEVDAERDPFPEAASLRLLRRARAVVVPSEHARGLLNVRDAELAARCTVLPPAVDPARFDPAAAGGTRIAAFAERWNIPPEGRVVLVPAPLQPGHGHLRLVEALAEPGLTDVHLLLSVEAASPGFVRELERRLADAGLAGRVRYVDPSGDRVAAFALADVVVWLPDSPPLSAPRLIEAQAMGRPVITVMAGAAEEVVEPVLTGWLVDPDRPGELESALVRALALDEGQRARLAERARRFVLERFALPRRVRRLLALHARLLEEAPLSASRSGP